ncbi:phage integrase N-terminal SAM-like domain-containing protein [Spiribacter halobius]|nr:phage integrase N-terminal SAM-like domain-containing protein [Spiribacter halobius]UEX76289.1 site-specific integrase [Spiribacter halobius]
MDSQRKPRLMERVRRTLRTKRYSRRTEKSYCYWIRYFIRFHGLQHPAAMDAREVRSFLEHLAVERHVAAATQNQALNAIVFLYRRVLEQPIGNIGAVTRARRTRRLPVVLSHAEVLRVLACMRGDIRLLAERMYGSGLRVTEVSRLRRKAVGVVRQSGASGARAAGVRFEWRDAAS